MQVTQIWLADFRSYKSLDLELPAGLTAIVGNNGQGKTNVLEAVGWLATMGSFRGATNDALVRDGADTAIARAEVLSGDRRGSIEAEIARTGRSRVLVNKQRLPRARDLLGQLRVTVFAPDDLFLVKGGPSGRRLWLDGVVVGVDARNDRVRSDYEKVLRQRNALLKQAGGRLTSDIASTLDVWDSKLSAAGDRLGQLRDEVVGGLASDVDAAYAHIAGRATVTMEYEAPWRPMGLAAALEQSRADDIRRGVTTVGPHRDEVGLAIDGLAARTHRSQGEQRSLALALQLASHRLVERSTGSSPVLLLDDVFSELDDGRARALLDQLPAVQTLLTSAVGVPEGTHPDLVVEVRDGQANRR